MPNDDLTLLREYSRNQSEAAFAALVSRHVNLVYSVALRQVRDPHLAEEITQAVFIILARKADAIGDKTILPGWLCRTARYVSVRALRTQIRRQQREHEAHMQTQIQNDLSRRSEAEAETWTHIEPLLDGAMGRLGQKDHDALVLRFFENKNFAEVGAALGTGEDAAKMRVNRALEKLRKIFTKHGIVSTTAILAGAISANAVSAAPAGLAATISAAVSGSTLTTATIVAATKALAMTTLQKTLITTALITTIGAGFYEAHQNSQLREQNQTLQQQQTSLSEQIRQLLRERDDATNRLASLADEMAKTKSNNLELLRLRGEVTQSKLAANDPVDAAAKAWLDRVNRLKQRLEQNPDANIPELRYLTEQDWLNAASGKLDNDTDYRKATALLRNAGENKFCSMVESALQKYSPANGGQFPTDLAQLQPYFDTPVDDAVLQRWEITSAKTAPNLGLGDPIITQKAAVDDLFDSRMAIGPHGFGSSDFLSSEIKNTLGPVYQAYQDANNGQEPGNPSQLVPYASTAEQKALLQKVIQRGELYSK